MKERAILYRNKIMGFLYRHALKHIFFLMDPEFTHKLMTDVGIVLGRWSMGRAITSLFFNYQNPILAQTIKGITFKNPVGLAAGFDKDAVMIDIMPEVGFGYTEVGSVTAEPCVGNPRPRLWRLKKSKGLGVYYGLKNEGCKKIFDRLNDKKFTIPVGVSIAMTNCRENLELEHAIRDYATGFKTMEPVADYITVNISCPNAEGGQTFSDPERLDQLFNTLDKIPTAKPIFIKLSPDVSDDTLDRILDTLKRHRVHGIICSNLTKKRDNKNIIDRDVPAKGGLSGKIVQELADKKLAYIYKREGKRFILVGCGGIFTAEDAYKKIRLGASLVQIITGMIYEGPQVISEINQGLARLLERDDFTNITQAIGADN